MWFVVWVTVGSNKMPLITLPDGTQKTFDQPISIMDVAMDIGPGLAKATIAG